MGAVAGVLIAQFADAVFSHRRGGLRLSLIHICGVQHPALGGKSRRAVCTISDPAAHRHGLFHNDVLACLQRHPGVAGVLQIGHGNVDHVYPLQQDVYKRQPVTITSAYRTPAHNAKAGGAKFSQHLYGRAADIRVQDCLLYTSRCV